MKKRALAVIVNFCSNEARFIQSTLEQAELFARQIIVPVCDHFFDGKPENRALLEQIYAAFPHCLFIEYPFIPEKIPKGIWKRVNPAHFWHSLSRLIGFSFLDESIETVLFLDADEVPDGARFAEWLECSDYHTHAVLKLANYWYFRDPSNQALQFEDSIVLARKSALDWKLILREEERDAIYNLLPGPKRRNVTCATGEPMFHHYSWVRTEEEMLQKVKAWGHKEDRNWSALVKEEFEKPFRGVDFVHGYRYKAVKPAFPIRADALPAFEWKKKPNPKKLQPAELLKLLPKKVPSLFSLDF